MYASTEREVRPDQHRHALFGIEKSIKCSSRLPLPPPTIGDDDNILLLSTSSYTMLVSARDELRVSSVAGWVVRYHINIRLYIFIIK